MFDFPRPTIHKTIYIGGLGMTEPKPLDEKFSILMKKGKTKGDTTTSTFVEGLNNCDLVEWLPQKDVLAHPRLRLFVMHGGINGLMEALLRAVPVVVVPIFADQFRNGRNAEKRGVGKPGVKKKFTCLSMGASPTKAAIVVRCCHIVANNGNA
ncbi:hypothetical protein COOONC_15978 [Cooperia oncophora]